MQINRKVLRARSVFLGQFQRLFQIKTYPSNQDAEERRRKLLKRLIDMTDKLEELSNQIYHLQQRVELLEKKLDVNRFN